MKYKTIVFETCGYTEVIRDGERHRITFETIGIRSRIEKRKLPFELPNDLEAIVTNGLNGYVFKICKSKRLKVGT